MNVLQIFQLFLTNWRNCGENAFILYQKCGGPMTRLTFILTLIDGIIEKHHSSYYATPGRPSHSQNPLP